MLLSSLDTLVTGSFDRTVRAWDPRSPTPCTAKLTLPERVYQMDVAGTNLVVGMAGRQFHIYDVRNLKEGEQPIQRRESSLKYMTRSLACMTDGKGKRIVVASRHEQWNSYDALFRVRHGLGGRPNSGGIFRCRSTVPKIRFQVPQADGERRRSRLAR